MTIRDAARALRLPLEELERQIAVSEVAAYYKDEHAEVQIITRWAYEKCSIWKCAGVCMDYDRLGEEAQGDGVKHVQGH